MIDIRDDTGKLLMRYDPIMDVIEVKRRGVKSTIDLKQYKESVMNAEEELKRIKLALLHRFIQAGSPVTLEDMTLEFCIDLLNDVSEDYIRLKSAKSAAQQQGGAYGRRTIKRSIR